MRLGLLLPTLLGVIVLGAVWLFALRPDDPASRVRAARERAERVREKGDLPWEDPSWREEFDWLERDSKDSGLSRGSTVLALSGSGDLQVTTASLSREESAGAGVPRRAGLTDTALNFSVRVKAPSGDGLAGQHVSIRALDDEFIIETDESVTDDEGLLHFQAPAGRYQLVCSDGLAEFSVQNAGERIELTVGETAGE